MEIDLKDPENPKIISTELCYGGEKKCMTFETRKDMAEMKKEGPDEKKRWTQARRVALTDTEKNIGSAWNLHSELIFFEQYTVL
ncbi:hypothetical protein [Succinivibrio dextrinosolvens]|uniref:hypothetical protein n=1 Tax=Succinivibrio dextrinosolvens TaxID=83771 RepID=UPI00192261E2|nr:hypothetical protein [Succinivibrio dextrinosolvens]